MNKLIVKHTMAVYLAAAAALLLFMGFPFVDMLDYTAQPQAPLVPVTPNIDRTEIEMLLNNFISFLRTGNQSEITSLAGQTDGDIPVGKKKAEQRNKHYSSARAQTLRA
jgi:hypothetical protein